ncbi:MAG: DUF3124 domain-containing protein [Sideroxydans sp.]|nr:DUF3124 domain-containing protein [Sideroxydans sp.]
MPELILTGNKMKIEFVRTALRFVLMGILSYHNCAIAQDEKLSSGQTLYLPIYSHIWHGDRSGVGQTPLKTPLSVLVSIRNTNHATPLQLHSARYSDSSGKLLKQFVIAPVTIGPLSTYEIFIEKHDVQGGSGANLILQWGAAVPVNVPIVEAIHAEIKGHSTLTFMTQAQSINDEK